MQSSSFSPSLGTLNKRRSELPTPHKLPKRKPNMKSPSSQFVLRMAPMFEARNSSSASMSSPRNSSNTTANNSSLMFRSPLQTRCSPRESGNLVQGNNNNNNSNSKVHSPRLSASATPFKIQTVALSPRTPTTTAAVGKENEFSGGRNQGVYLKFSPPSNKTTTTNGNNNNNNGKGTPLRIANDQRVGVSSSSGSCSNNRQFFNSPRPTTSPAMTGSSSKPKIVSPSQNVFMRSPKSVAVEDLVHLVCRQHDMIRQLQQQVQILQHSHRTALPPPPPPPPPPALHRSSSAPPPPPPPPSGALLNAKVNQPPANLFRQRSTLERSSLQLALQEELRTRFRTRKTIDNSVDGDAAAAATTTQKKNLQLIQQKNAELLELAESLQTSSPLPVAKKIVSLEEEIDSHLDAIGGGGDLKSRTSLIADYRDPSSILNVRLSRAIVKMHKSLEAAATHAENTLEQYSSSPYSSSSSICTDGDVLMTTAITTKSQKVDIFQVAEKMSAARDRLVSVLRDVTNPTEQEVSTHLSLILSALSDEIDRAQSLICSVENVCISRVVEYVHRSLANGASTRLYSRKSLESLIEMTRASFAHNENVNLLPAIL